MTSILQATIPEFAATETAKGVGGVQWMCRGIEQMSSQIENRLWHAFDVLRFGVLCGALYIAYLAPVQVCLLARLVAESQRG